MFFIKEIVDKDQKRVITLDVMNALPKWFSPPEDILRKSEAHREYLFFAAFDSDIAIGFVAAKIHNSYTAEIYVIGVLEEFHHQGIGHKLLSAVELFVKTNGYKFLTVKTLDSSVEYEPYNQTRNFYINEGFFPLEVFPTFWDENNPCLFLAKYIG